MEETIGITISNVNKSNTSISKSKITSTTKKKTLVTTNQNNKLVEIEKPSIDLKKHVPKSQPELSPIQNLTIEYVPVFDELNLSCSINVIINHTFVGNICKVDQYIDPMYHTLVPVERFLFTVYNKLNYDKFIVDELRASDLVILKTKIEEHYKLFFNYAKRWEMFF